MAISKKYACTEDEKRFCLAFLAGLNMTEAFRRFMTPVIEEWEGKHGRKMDNKEMTRRAKYLLERHHIQGYIDELTNADPAAIARMTLVELAAFGDRAASEKILEQEEKLSFQTGQERWAAIMCAIGTEVVVPLPGGGEVAFPLGSMFPQFADATPPAEAIEKTIKSLDQHLWVKNHPDPENMDVQDWRHGDGIAGRYPS